MNELDYFLKKELFKKLNFTKIYIPSLVERKDDFVDLIKAFIKQSSEKRNINKQVLSDNFIQLLNKENFFDNYSQLEKFIDWVIVMFETKKKDIITHEIFEKLMFKIIRVNKNSKNDEEGFFNLKLKEARDSFEKKFLMYNLKKFKYNIPLLSQKIGMERTALYRKLKSMKINLDIK